MLDVSIFLIEGGPLKTKRVSKVDLFGASYEVLNSSVNVGL